jgi:hypothetical protein
MFKEKFTLFDFFACLMVFFDLFRLSRHEIIRILLILMNFEVLVLDQLVVRLKNVFIFIIVGGGNRYRFTIGILA